MTGSQLALRSGPHRRLRVLSAIVVASVASAALLAAVLVGLPSRGGPPRPALTAAAATDVHAFLRTYVTPGGAVVRRDQGGDVVSEGQAYGLLLAHAAGDRQTFARIWEWTRAHLQRPDGLLASLADPAGTVRDPSPASDADLLAAWALSRAGSRYGADARRIAAAILTHETARRGGELMLAAGSWATGRPTSLNPSYWTPHVFRDLGRFTGDGRWALLARSARSLTSDVTQRGRRLPPDWARVDGTAITATAAPDRHVPQVQYGLDAQRLVVWLAVSCDPADRRLAAAWWPLLSAPERGSAMALDPTGTVLDGARHVMPLVAAAAAAGAAGRVADRDRLLGLAARAQAAAPTYYGAAWLALGRALLTSSVLGGCAGDGGPR